MGNIGQIDSERLQPNLGGLGNLVRKVNLFYTLSMGSGFGLRLFKMRADIIFYSDTGGFWRVAAVCIS